jgi:hypothetical protein
MVMFRCHICNRRLYECAACAGSGYEPKAAKGAAPSRRPGRTKERDPLFSRLDETSPEGACRVCGGCGRRDHFCD